MYKVLVCLLLAFERYSFYEGGIYYTLAQIKSICIKGNLNSTSYTIRAAMNVIKEAVTMHPAPTRPVFLVLRRKQHSIQGQFNYEYFKSKSHSHFMKCDCER